MPITSVPSDLRSPAPSRCSSPTGFSSPLAAAFLDEWQRLRGSAAVREQVIAWELPPELGGPIEVSGRSVLDELLDRVGFLRSQTEDCTDVALLALVRLAGSEPLAARVVLQRLLPGLVAVARRRGRLVGGAQAAFEELVATAWIAIRTYPVDRRPRKVASNLVRDTEYLAFVRPQRLRASSERIGLPGEAVASTAVLDGGAVELNDASEEAAELLALAERCGLPEHDLAFTREWLAGADTTRLCERFSISERTVRNRRNQVVHRLRSVAVLAGAA